MSKKHFRRLAWDLAQIEPADPEYRSHLVWHACCEAVADTCAACNSNFQRGLFLAACHAKWWEGKKPLQ